MTFFFILTTLKNVAETYVRIVISAFNTFDSEMFFDLIEDRQKPIIILSYRFKGISSPQLL